MRQLYLPMLIESQEFRAVLNLQPYNQPVVAVEGTSAQDTVRQAASQIDRGKKSGLVLTVSRVEQLVLVNGEEIYRTVAMN